MSHLSESGDPSEELVTDCNVGTDHEMSVAIRAIEHIWTCTESIHDSIQEVARKAQTYTLLFATEHSKVLLGVGFHVDLGKLHSTLPGFFFYFYALHAIQAESDRAVIMNIPCEDIIVTVADNQFEGADFVGCTFSAVYLLCAILNSKFLIFEGDFLVLTNGLIDF